MEPSERRQGDPEMRCWSTEKDAQQFREYAEAQEAKCDALRAALAQMTAEMHTAFEEAARICEWEGNDSDSISRERLIAVARIIRSKPIQSPSLKDTLTTLRAELAQVTAERDEYKYRLQTWNDAHAERQVQP